MPRRGVLNAHQPKKQSSMTSCMDYPAKGLTMELDQRFGATSAIKSNELTRKIFVFYAFSRILAPLFGLPGFILFYHRTDNDSIRLLDDVQMDSDPPSIGL